MSAGDLHEVARLHKDIGNMRDLLRETRLKIPCDIKQAMLEMQQSLAEGERQAASAAKSSQKALVSIMAAQVDLEAVMDWTRAQNAKAKGS